MCVNFYDVHTQTQGSYIAKAGDITVDGNGDNSIDTNAFNVNDTSQGGNCIAIATAGIVTTATDTATVGGNIHDTAVLSGIPAGTTGKLLFKAYKRTGANPDCTGTAAFTSALIPTSGSDTKSSGDFDTGAAGAGAGTYDWLVTWTSDDPLILGVTSACGDQTGGNDETSVVGKANPALSTDAGSTVRLGG